MAAGIYSKLDTKVPTKCCYFNMDQNSKMDALACHCPTHFRLLLKKGCSDLLQKLHKCSLWCPDEVLLHFLWIRNPKWPSSPLIVWHIFDFFSGTASGIYSNLAQMVLMGSTPSVVTVTCFVDPKSKLAVLASDWLTHFQLLLKNGLQEYTPNLAQILFMGWSQPSVVTFMWIQNPVWPPWPLIVWHIFDLLLRMAAGIYFKLGTHVPYGILTKCCYFLCGKEVQGGHP